MLYIIPTIDTENMQTAFFNEKYGNDMLDYYHDGQPWATTRLADIFESFGVEATFFIAVNEADKLGEDKLRKLVGKLTERKQDVQIHSHPIWADSQVPPRELMSQYSLDEQIQLISNMKRKLRDWTDKWPVAHRAGAYGLDGNTLKALKHNDIHIDSSMLHGHPNCKVTWSKNNVASKDGLVEIPATGMYVDKILDFGLFKYNYKKAFIKTDLNHCALEELMFFVKEAKCNNLKVMNFFMHSYSLIKFDKGFKNFKPSFEEEKKLIDFIQMCNKDDNIKFISVGEFWKIYQDNKLAFSGSDFAPECKKTINIYKKAAEKIVRRFR